MVEQKCENCYFWRIRKDDTARCFLNPPYIVMTPGTLEKPVQLGSLHPITRAEDFCGSFNPAARESDK